MKQKHQRLVVRRLKIGNKILEYCYKGEGNRNIVFVHGLNSSWRDWEKVLPKISPQFKCWAVSLPKYRDCKTKISVKLLKTFIDRMGIKEPFLVGHSLGGLICLWLILKGLYAQGIILVSTPLADKPPKIISILSNGLKTLVDKGNLIEKFSPDFLSKIWLGRELLNLECYCDTLKSPIARKFSQTNPQYPILIVYGKRDFRLKLSHGTSLYKKIAPASTKILDTMHSIPTDLPEKLAKIINDFSLGKKGKA